MTQDEQDLCAQIGREIDLMLDRANALDEREVRLPLWRFLKRRRIRSRRDALYGKIDAKFEQIDQISSPRRKAA